MDQASHNGLVAGSSPAGPTNLPNKSNGVLESNGLREGSLNLSAAHATRFGRAASAAKNVEVGGQLLVLLSASHWSAPRP